MKLFSFNISHSFLLYLSSPSVPTPTVSGCLSETGRGLCCSEGEEVGLGCGSKGNAQKETSGVQRKQGRQSLLAHTAASSPTSCQQPPLSLFWCKALRKKQKQKTASQVAASHLHKKVKVICQMIFHVKADRKQVGFLESPGP